MNPFKNIALCLCGGGYRAAAFHLGMLDMLNDLGLSDSVVMFSSASGGTIFAASYAAWRIEQNPGAIDFGEFYGKFYQFLDETNIVKEALETLTDERFIGGPKH